MSRQPITLALVVALAGGSLAAASASGAKVTRAQGCATLGDGAVGPAVATIQELVKTTPDGAFGPMTATAVKKWQKKHDVSPTGVVDGATWAALPEDVAMTACGQQAHGAGVGLTCAHLHVGSTGVAVKVLQRAVDAEIDGAFGPVTAAAVQAAQQKAKLTGSGIAGPATWAALGLSGTPACMAVPVTDASAETSGDQPSGGDQPAEQPHKETKNEKAQRVIGEQVAKLADSLLTRDGATKNPLAQAALAFATKQKGKPYKWGADGPKSYDCSGLVLASYLHVGVTVPRVANDQYGAGTPVPLDRAKQGDLLFYASDLTDPRSIYHVVLYAGGGQVLDAPYTGAFVGTRPLWTNHLLPVAVRPASTLELPVHPGDAGAAVARLQEALNRAGAQLTVDGGYGPMTQAAVTAWKQAHDLKPTPKVGRKAWLALI